MRYNNMFQYSLTLITMEHTSLVQWSLVYQQSGSLNDQCQKNWHNIPQKLEPRHIPQIQQIPHHA